LGDHGSLSLQTFYEVCKSIPLHIILMGSGEQEALHYTDNFMSMYGFWDLCEEGKTYLPFREIQILFFFTKTNRAGSRLMVQE
jgi:hypothetical protein